MSRKGSLSAREAGSLLTEVRGLREDVRELKAAFRWWTLKVAGLAGSVSILTALVIGRA